MKIKPGTVISGTLRPESLVPAFTKELEKVDPDKMEEIEQEWGSVLEMIEEGEADFLDFKEDPEWLVDDLMEALNDAAPEGLYFGSHPGDGCDFGWWYHEPMGGA